MLSFLYKIHIYRNNFPTLPKGFIWGIKRLLTASIEISIVGIINFILDCQCSVIDGLSRMLHIKFPVFVIAAVVFEWWWRSPYPCSFVSILLGAAVLLLVLVLVLVLVIYFL
jgi:hypothetical protein